ncbi:Uncharacterised protein [BD1-7 clade bacterium]|uniref:Uncharacterized protein n=1 Tax=BD1-7 clade bacterium TaxID=2029982 RepID=A0A5S9R0N3_9GAMM|nr:Uncharacterised protein [BD1-7 clade bacterium]
MEKDLHHPPNFPGKPWQWTIGFIGVILFLIFLSLKYHEIDNSSPLRLGTVFYVIGDLEVETHLGEDTRYSDYITIETTEGDTVLVPFDRGIDRGDVIVFEEYDLYRTLGINYRYVRHR